MTLDFTVLKNGFPVFTLRSSSGLFKGVYGARYVPKYGLWLFPAAAPFFTRVLEDIDMLHPGIQRTDKVLQHLASAGQPFDIDPLLPNYEHQDEAVQLLLQHPRYGLFLDRGLGKTKTIIETVRELRKRDPSVRALILALRVNLYTWVDEFKLFTKDEIECVPLKSLVYVPKGVKEQVKKDREEARVAAQVALRRKIGPLPSNASPAQKRTRVSMVNKAIKKMVGEVESGSYRARAAKIEKLVQEQDPKVLVLTYETASAATQPLLDHFDYSIIVADESHRLRGHKTGITKAALKLAAKAGRRYLVTGTPSLGNPLHVWGQFRFLGDFLVPDFWTFRKRFIVTAPGNHNFILGFKNMDKLAALTDSISTRKTSEECLDLPERVFQHHSLEPSAKQKRVYNSLIEDRVINYAGVEVEIEEPVVLLNKLVQLSAGFYYVDHRDPTICDECEHKAACVAGEISPYTKACKVVTKAPPRSVHWPENPSPVVTAVVDLVKEHLEGGNKVIVWAKHLAVMDQLEQDLKQCVSGKPNSLLMYDSRSNTPPHEIEAAFNNSPTAQVLVAQISMGIGVTFKAPIMVYAEVDWRLDFWLQSLDRNYGIRAKGFTSLLVQTVAVRGSVTESTLKLLKEKRNVADLLSRKPSCVGCDRASNCLATSVEPFEDGCKYDKTTSLAKVKPRFI
jgi:SNF2 family DNA or RNA helicase